ncbi:MAG: N-acetylglucosamine-6-phosphate deacetylase [Proteobacteria bacterium]|nr:N-acetylglucosamine-6-phosphate deacetylase [Pseudomonadota bacterium]
MRRVFVNGRIHAAGAFLTGHALLVDGGRIDAIVPEGDVRLDGAERHDLGGRLLLPGFIDTQVNGGGGVLFNDAPTVEGIRAIGAAHASGGTTGFLPTLISDDLEVVTRGIAAVDAAIAAGVPGVLGIHIEGPYLSEARAGVHDPARFRALDEAAVPRLGALRRGRTLVTLAPEMTTPEAFTRLAAAGVILSAGHTNATGAQIESALARGLRGFTHLFNAMSPLTSREPGVVGTALADDTAWCGIIVDGRHVDPRVLKLALKIRRHDRFMLVTDAMPAVGTDARSSRLQERTLRVEGDCCVDENGTLAGTALTMSRAVRNAVSLLGLAPAEAVRMASEYPAEFLGLGATHGRLAPGLRADLLVADAMLEVHETWIDGQLIATGKRA